MKLMKAILALAVLVCFSVAGIGTALASPMLSPDETSMYGSPPADLTVQAGVTADAAVGIATLARGETLSTKRTCPYSHSLQALTHLGTGNGKYEVGWQRFLS